MMTAMRRRGFNNLFLFMIVGPLFVLGDWGDGVLEEYSGNICQETSNCAGHSSKPGKTVLLEWRKKDVS
ncbi:MAG: hypothetical protein HFI04_11080 [Lachnospiraceae bacterium]|nr:hypothetical protein [Lachnospiraceae bacterium]